MPMRRNKIKSAGENPASAFTGGTSDPFGGRDGEGARVLSLRVPLLRSSLAGLPTTRMSGWPRSIRDRGPRGPSRGTAEPPAPSEAGWQTGPFSIQPGIPAPGFAIRRAFSDFALMFGRMYGQGNRAGPGSDAYLGPIFAGERTRRAGSHAYSPASFPIGFSFALAGRRSSATKHEEK